jgi:hypothetical protein
MISMAKEPIDSRPKFQSHQTSADIFNNLPILTLSPNRADSYTSGIAVALQSFIAMVLTHM